MGLSPAILNHRAFTDRLVPAAVDARRRTPEPVAIGLKSRFERRKKRGSSGPFDNHGRAKELERDQCRTCGVEVTGLSSASRCPSLACLADRYAAFSAVGTVTSGTRSTMRSV